MSNYIKTEYMGQPIRGSSTYWAIDDAAREEIVPVPGDTCIMKDLGVYFCWESGVWTKCGGED